MSETISIVTLKNAKKIFEEFRVDMKTDRDKAGAVQSFEFCYELAWKTMKRVLASRGLEAESPKDVFRKAAKDKIIDDPEIWFDFQKKRNLTVHTYEHKNLEIIITSFEDFSNELSKFISKVDSLNDSN